MNRRINPLAVSFIISMFLISFYATVCGAAAVVIDNDKTGYDEPGYTESSSNWQTSTNTALGSIDNNHRWTNAASSWASWTPNLEGGYYKVYFNRVSHEATNDPAAELVVVHNGKTESQPIDLRQTKGYVPIGIYDFAGGGTGEYVMLKHKTTGKNIRADAVKFVSVPFNPELTVVETTANSAGLVWNSQAWATGYKLYRSASADGPFSEIYSGATPSHTDSGLSPSTVYYYALSAYDSEAETVKSPSVTAQTTPPPAIVQFAFGPDMGTSVSVTTSIYGKSPADIVGQTISFAANRREGAQPAVVTPASTITGNVYSAAPDGTYFLTIPVTFNKLGGFGDIVYDITAELNGFSFSSAYTDHRVPAAPSELVVARTTLSTIELIWQPAVGAASYRIYRTTYGSEQYDYIGETTDTRFVDEDVENGEHYQ